MAWLNLCIINLTPLVTHSFLNLLKTLATCQGSIEKSHSDVSPQRPLRSTSFVVLNKRCMRMVRRAIPMVDK